MSKYVRSLDLIRDVYKLEQRTSALRAAVRSGDEDAIFVAIDSAQSLVDDMSFRATYE